MVRLSLRAPRTALVLAAAFLSAGCSRVWLPEKLEKQAGRLASESLLRRFPEDKDALWHDYVTRLGKRIAPVTERPDFDYRFRIIDTPIVNAFSLPDGTILITTGLLKLTNGNELALAGVIGHEMGHIARRHSAEQLQAKLGYRGASFFLFGFHSTIAGQGAQIAAQLADVGYGREMELEADLCAVRYLSRLGYPPASTVAFLRKLRQTEAGQTSSLAQTLQNHPPASERLQYAQAYIHRTLLHESPSGAAPAAIDGLADGLFDPLNNYIAMFYEAQGLANVRRKAYDAAVDSLTKSIAAAPRRASLPNTYDIRAGVYFEKKDMVNALADYAKAIELNPWDPKPYLNRGSIYARMGDPDRSLAECSRAVEVDPDSSKAYECRALAYYRKNDPRDCAVEGARAVELDAKSGGAYSLLGWAYHSLKDEDRAIDAFSRALELNPKDGGSRYERGDAHLERKDFDLAIADYSELIETGSRDPAAYASRAKAYLGKGDPARAIADAEKALSFNSRLPLPYVVRGFAHVLAGDYDQAVNDCSIAIQLSHYGLPGYQCRLLAYRAKGDYARARVEADQAVALSSGNAESHEGMAWVDLDSGRYPAALRGFKETLRLSPDADAALETQVGIALVLFKQKKRAAALAAYRDLEKTDPGLADRPFPELTKRGAYYTNKDRALIETLAAVARKNPARQ